MSYCVGHETNVSTSDTIATTKGVKVTFLHSQPTMNTFEVECSQPPHVPSHNMGVCVCVCVCVKVHSELCGVMSGSDMGGISE